MISIDTNILLRHILSDDPKQTAKAGRLFYSGETILVTDVVLVETIWTLKSKRYGAQKDDIMALVSSLLAEPNITLESQSVVWSALDDYTHAKRVATQGGKKTADFSDTLIVSKSREIAAQRKEVLGGVCTFDQATLELDGTRKP